MRVLLLLPLLPYLYPDAGRGLVVVVLLLP